MVEQRCEFKDLLMAERRRRKLPKTDALEHAAKALDKIANLEVKFINTFKGRGVFTKTNFQKGEFVLEYRGELIDSEEIWRRTFLGKCTGFMFDFFWHGKQWCVDASQEDGSFGRLVNDDHLHPNCKMKMIVSDGKPHLFLFALRDINAGEEITYNYGGNDCPWRQQVGGQAIAHEASETATSRKIEQDRQGSASIQNQVGGQAIAHEASETSTSRKIEQDRQGSASIQNQVGGQAIAHEASETATSRKIEQDRQGSASIQNQVGGQAIAHEASETSTSRKIEQDRQGSASIQNQVGGQAIAHEASETSTSRKIEQDRQGSASIQNQVGGQAIAHEASETSTSRKIEQDRQGSASIQNQVGGQAIAHEASETATSRKIEQDRQGSASIQNQVGGQAIAHEASETSTSRKIEQDRQGSASIQNQVGGQAIAHEASETSTSRKIEQDRQGSASIQNQVGGQAIAHEASETATSRKIEQDRQGSASIQNQVGGQAIAHEASETSTSRKIEQDRQGSASIQNQVGGQAIAHEASETATSRKIEQDRQGSASIQNQVGGQAIAHEASETSTSRKIEQDRQGSASIQNQVGGQAIAHEASETATSRKIEQDRQGSASIQNQVGGQAIAHEASETSTSRKIEQDRQGSASIQNQDPESSDSQPSSSEVHRNPVPRLRRTKSIQMNNRVHFDSDELFDPTSDESGEEYIPKSSEDDSESSVTSEILQTDDQKIKHRWLNINTADQTRERCVSQTELNDGSSMQVPNRGRSPSRKGCSSGMRHKRPRLNTGSHPTPRTNNGCSSKQSEEEETGALLEKSASDLEHNLPDSTSSPTDDIADGSLSITAVCKKTNGSRMYNKKQFCLYCKIGVVKMARHLERAHSNKPEVAQAVSFPKGSKERQMHLEHLRNRGNFAHNVDVLNAGAGTLVPRKRPQQDSQAQNYLHCVYCQGYFTKKVLWRHMNVCKFRPSVPKKPGKTRVQALCAFAVPPPPGVKEELWKLLSNMVQDEVSSAVKSDVCIMEYGEHLYNRLGYDVGKHEYIRQKLRELGRLLMSARTTTPLKTIEDHIKPANFMHVVQAVKHTTGHDSKTDTYKCPSLALKIGHSLTKIALLVESRANVKKDYSTAKDARTFRRVYETKWNELISAASLRTLKESKWNVPLLLPFTKDVQTLHSYLDVQQQKLCSNLSTDTSPQTWAELAKVTLTQVILFNRRRAGEVSKMPLFAYLSQNPSDSQEDVNEALTDLEKKLCQHFKRVEIRGKRGRKVPVLLTPPMQQSLDVLVSKRQECGVPEGNTYLFARPFAFTCYRGSDCLRHFAKACGAKCPENLTSTKLRKQTGTLSQVLNLSNTELDQLADFLGHDIRVHRQFYRLPEGTLQLAKISKVLMALGQGRLAEFKGKNLDDIIIDPEENVHVDSDTEVVDESEPQDSEVTSTQKEVNKTTMPDINDSDAAPPQGAMTPSQASTYHKSPKKGKGRQPFKRKMWEKDEILAVEKHMMSFITTCRVPGKNDCDKCLQQEKIALKDRNWLAIKFYIKNRITSLKSKV